MKFSKANIIVLVGAVLLILGFYLPWVKVGAMGFGMELSGSGLVSAGAAAAGVAAAGAYLYLLPLAGAACLILFFLTKGKVKKAAVGYLVSAAVSGALWVMLFVRMQGALSKAKQATGMGLFGPVSVEAAIQLGFYLVGLGAVLLLVGGIMRLKEGDSEQAPVTSFPQ